jgi:hypothetical protein
MRCALICAAVTAVGLGFAHRDCSAQTPKPLLASVRGPFNNAAGRVVVWPGGLHGWVFYDEQASAGCTRRSACQLVQGPVAKPFHAGSAELATPRATDGKALLLADYGGTRFDQITELTYSTYRQSPDSGNNLAISLQFQRGLRSH